MSTEFSAEIMRKLYEYRMIRTWLRDRPEGWVLVSGLWSPFYLQLRELASYPDLLRLVGNAMASKVAESQHVTRLAGIAYAGIPIATAASLASGVPMLMMRKATPGDIDDLTSHGQHALVEGVLEGGDQVMLVDDLVTRFDSKLAGARQVLAEYQRRGVEGACHDVLVVVDRGQGAAATAEAEGFSLRALVNLRDEALELLKPELHPLEYDTICEYLERPEGFQDERRQSDLRQAGLRAIKEVTG